MAEIPTNAESRRRRVAQSRRELVVGGVAMTLAPPATAKQMPGSLKADVDTFVKFGIHRAGTLGETRTSRWVSDRLKSLGYSTTINTLPIRTVLNPRGEISVGAFKAAAFPQWRASARTLRDPVVAPLTNATHAAAGKILVLPTPFPPGAYWSSAQQRVVDGAFAAEARALIIAIDDPTDSLYACNQDSANDLPLPVATVARSALNDLNRHAESGHPARLSLDGKPFAGSARYVLGHKPGLGQAIVISTPLTGWFHCGAERGPGVALMLALARALAKVPRPVWLVATGAHELGHLGMKAALGSNRLPTPADTSLWLHLGAGIAARSLDRKFDLKPQQGLTVSPVLIEPTRELLADWPRIPASPAAPGESGDVIAAGYDRVVGLASGFPGFHTPGDLGEAIDFPRLDQIGRDLEAAILRITDR